MVETKPVTQPSRHMTSQYGSTVNYLDKASDYSVCLSVVLVAFVFGCCKPDGYFLGKGLNASVTLLFKRVIYGVLEGSK